MTTIRELLSRIRSGPEHRIRLLTADYELPETLHCNANKLLSNKTEKVIGRDRVVHTLGWW